MPDLWLIIILHQAVFQGMFVIKNILLRVKTGKPVRGNNIEATISICYFACFIIISLIISFLKEPFGTVQLLERSQVIYPAAVLMGLNLVVSVASLSGLKDSWRVGITEDQKTELITGGIYRFTRNPYFVSYFLMFAAYTVLLQNLLLLGLSGVGFLVVHKMVLKEEGYLLSVHGDKYRQYRQRVPRYLIL